MDKFDIVTRTNGPPKTVNDETSPASKMGKIPKLKLRDFISALKLFQPCCFPGVASTRLSGSRRSSMVKPRSRTQSMAVYTIKTACGRLNALKETNKEALEVFLPVKDEVIARLIEHEGDNNGNTDLRQGHGKEINLILISYKTQSVVGTNYFLKIRVNDGPVYLHARIYQPVDGEPFLTDLSFNKSEKDEIEYF